MKSNITIEIDDEGVSGVAQSGYFTLISTVFLPVDDLDGDLTNGLKSPSRLAF